MLLDEGRLADRGPGDRRPALPQRPPGDFIDQNFDHYSVEYTFDDGTKLILESRNMPGCWQNFASYAHGTKGSAIISAESHTPAYSRIYKGQHIPFGRPKRNDPNVVWKGPAEEPIPYQVEWDDLIAAIRQDKPYNEVERGTDGQPGHVDGPHGLPHRPDHHSRPDARTATTNSRRASRR